LQFTRGALKRLREIIEAARQLTDLAGGAQRQRALSAFAAKRQRRRYQLAERARNLA
jgi:hypothetical protein